MNAGLPSTMGRQGRWAHRRFQFSRPQRPGMTLVELLIGVALLVGGGSALFLGIQQNGILTDHLSNMQIAMNAAQSQLEVLKASSFDELVTGARYQLARTAGRAQCAGTADCSSTVGSPLVITEDVNGNGVLDPGEDLNGNGRLDTALPLLNGQVMFQIRTTNGGVPVDLRNPDSPDLVDVQVSVCWQSRGRNFGEDQNCNGMLDPGEDTNGNGWIDSPATVSTRIGRRK